MLTQMQAPQYIDNARIAYLVASTNAARVEEREGKDTAAALAARAIEMEAYRALDEIRLDAKRAHDQGVADALISTSGYIVLAGAWISLFNNDLLSAAARPLNYYQHDPLYPHIEQGMSASLLCVWDEEAGHDGEIVFVVVEDESFTIAPDSTVY